MDRQHKQPSLKDRLDKATGKTWITIDDPDSAVYTDIGMEDGSFARIGVKYVFPFGSRKLKADVFCSRGIAFSILMCYDFLPDLYGYIDSLDPVACTIRKIDDLIAMGTEALLDDIHAHYKSWLTSADILADPFRFTDYSTDCSDGYLVRYIAAKAING